MQNYYKIKLVTLVYQSIRFYIINTIDNLDLKVNTV